ncbi:hypothetical protein BT69DRAFT_1285560 [Atractiella rhizophila]|nr:hypothetical protein BT69DRAFT_1287471 [Atractiella rhizophila]KAH8918574.1 hypothetical protein BT69DRAFT_1285560 [Atractiella rhizophila]
MPFSHVAFVGLIVLLAGVASWYLTPAKAFRFNPDNVLVIRTSILLTLVSCYLMWAIVYLAQMNPLVAPIRSNLRVAEEPEGARKISMWQL